MSDKTLISNQSISAAELTPQDMEDWENIVMSSEPQGGPNYRSFQSKLGKTSATHAEDAEKPTGNLER